MITVAVSEQSGVSEARRRAVGVAQALGFDESGAGKVAIVVTELATNLVKHARGGLVVVRPLVGSALEILSIDSGPGMSDVVRCMQDGHSSAGTAGNGLGAIARLSSHYEFHSTRERGTVIRAVCASGKSTLPAQPFDVGCVSRPKPGQEVCGDAVTYAFASEGRIRLLMSDGLGHGSPAAEASRYAVEAFHDSQDLDVVRAVERLHTALRPTRGAAVAIADVDPNQNLIRFCGIGNISALVATPVKSSHLVSMSGIVGHQVRTFRSFEYQWSRESLLVIHSDGLSTRWDLDAYPGLRLRSAAVIAGVLYRDAQRTSDDATVAVVSGR